MNKKHLIWSLAALAIAGCSNNETVDINRGDAIAFRTVAENMTRSTVESTNTLRAFKVWGFTDNKTLMSGVEVTKKDGKWTYANTQFWPESSVDFYSVAPAGTAVNITAESQKIENFTVAEKVADQVDLLYAVNKGCTKEKNGESGVAVNFRHALSQIVFKAKNTNANLKVTVKGVEVVNVVNGGTFTYPGNTTAPNVTEESESIAAGTQGTWAPGTTKATYAAGITEATLSKSDNATDLTNTSGALLLMPQTITGWDVENDASNSAGNSYFLVDCKIVNVAGEDEVTLWPAEGESAKVAIPVSAITWEQGKKYIYTFIFGEGGGYVPPTEDDDEPEPVLVPISFTVTVDDFIPADEINVDMDTTKEEAGE